MHTFWDYARRHATAIAVVPVLIAIGLTLLTAWTVLVSIGAVWFLSALALFSGADTLDSIRSKLPRHKRGALVSFLQYGGYSIAAASMAGYFAFAFWTTYRPTWLVYLMFCGIFMFFSSGLVHKGRSRRNVR